MFYHVKIACYHAGPTWMRPGTQGQVAVPRGPMRRLHNDVTWRDIYMY